MVIFQPITENSLDIVLEILNSNTHYNILENGVPSRTIEDAKEFLNQNTESYLIILGNKYIGIIDFLEKNPDDNCPWIGLLMIHGEYHAKGFGKMSYHLFEEKLKQRGCNKVRIGILQENKFARKFWTSLGFKFYAFKQWKDKTIECFETQLIYGKQVEQQATSTDE